MDTVECPYCEYEQEIDHEDGYGYDGDETFTQECPCCGKVFAYQTEILFSYNVHTCDCQNGEDHKWKLMMTHPKFASRMECTECGERRSLTEEERQKFGIETKEEYFEKLKK